MCVNSENESLNNGNKRLCHNLEETTLLRRHKRTFEKELEVLKVNHESLKDDDAEFSLLAAQKRIKLLVKGSH